MDAFVDELTSWFKDRPGWLRDAARRLTQNDNISDQDIFELTLLCKKEAGICVDKDECIIRIKGIDDERTCDYCRYMWTQVGREGEIKLPPYHEHCRCWGVYGY